MQYKRIDPSASCNEEKCQIYAKVFPCNTNSLFVYKMRYIELKYINTCYSRKQMISDLLGFEEDEVRR